jgi:hypothetical protein
VSRKNYGFSGQNQRLLMLLKPVDREDNDTGLKTQSDLFPESVDGFESHIVLSQ